LRLLQAVPAVHLGGWMLADGLRAFIIGDCCTPDGGTFASQLGR
jgi:hypothetical protein